MAKAALMCSLHHTLAVVNPPLCGGKDAGLLAAE